MAMSKSLLDITRESIREDELPERGDRLTISKSKKLSALWLTSKRDRERRKEASGLSCRGEEREAWDKRGKGIA